MSGAGHAGPGLFGSTPIAGLTSKPDIVTPPEEAALTDRIDQSGLSPFPFQGWRGERLTTSYGSGYDFDNGGLAIAEPIPQWLEDLRTNVASIAGLAPAALSQVLLIRYDPGAGIGWHRDRSVYEQVIGVSLGAPTAMRFRRRVPSGFERVTVPLAPRSVDHLAGDVRHLWEHSIAETTETRWSVTFRSVSLSGQKALRCALIEEAAAR